MKKKKEVKKDMKFSVDTYFYDGTRSISIDFYTTRDAWYYMYHVIRTHRDVRQLSIHTIYETIEPEDHFFYGYLRRRIIKTENKEVFTFRPCYYNDHLVSHRIYIERKRG